MQQFIRCYWTLSTDGAALAPHRVLPDGSMEIVFHFAEPFARIHDDGSEQRQEVALLAGQIASPVMLRPAGRAEVLGVRFRALGAAPFFRFPMDEVCGRILPLQDAWGALARSFVADLGEARDPVARLDERLLAMRPRPVPSLLDLSSRQHRRRFQAAAGIPPKLYARIRRFQHVLGQIGRVPVADAAAACGYCDQSHLIRDFREFAGTSPGQWLRDRGDVLFLQDAVEAEALL